MFGWLFGKLVGLFVRWLVASLFDSVLGCIVESVDGWLHIDWKIVRLVLCILWPAKDRLCILSCVFIVQQQTASCLVYSLSSNRQTVHLVLCIHCVFTRILVHILIAFTVPPFLDFNIWEVFLPHHTIAWNWHLTFYFLFSYYYRLFLI